MQSFQILSSPILIISISYNSNSSRLFYSRSHATQTFYYLTIRLRARNFYEVTPLCSIVLTLHASIPIAIMAPSINHLFRPSRLFTSFFQPPTSAKKAVERSRNQVHLLLQRSMQETRDNWRSCRR